MKKLLFNITSVVLALTMLGACNGTGGNSSSPESSSSHTHRFSSTWKTDQNWHWVECACGETAAFGAHEYTEWIADRENHWQACICGEKKNKEAHQWVTINGVEVCNTCNHSISKVTSSTEEGSDFFG